MLEFLEGIGQLIILGYISIISNPLVVIAASFTDFAFCALLSRGPLKTNLLLLLNSCMFQGLFLVAADIIGTVFEVNLSYTIFIIVMLVVIAWARKLICRCAHLIKKKAWICAICGMLLNIIVLTVLTQNVDIGFFGANIHTI